MGTRSLTHFKNGEGEVICTLYRQYDGDFSGHGVDLAEIMAGHKGVNGISDRGDKIYNGLGDLVVRVITALKNRDGGEDSAGQFYIMEPGIADVGEEYVYDVTLDLGSEPLIVGVSTYGEQQREDYASEWANEWKDSYND